MSTSAVRRCSVDEYLAREATSDVKHEYFDGEVFAMAGGTIWHSLIATNLARALGAALADRGCRVLNSDMAVWCPTGLRTYPDVSVVCEEPRFERDDQRTLLNPATIVEVLSDTTEAYDRGRKFDHYRTIESLREYVLVAQDRPHVDRFTRRPGGEWLLVGSDRLDASAGLPTLGCTLPLTAVYAGVEFPPPAPTEANSLTPNPSPPTPPP